MNKDIIRLDIPKKKEYLTLARLTSSSVAGKLGFDIEEIDDIRVSIGEACLNSFTFAKKDHISIVLEVEENLLKIFVSEVKEEIVDSLEESKNLDLGLMIINSLMDKVEFDEEGLVMTKYVKEEDL